MFTHLHTHTEYSLLDGLSGIPQLVARAQELGQTALATTDHGNLYGAIQLYEAANAQGVKPIIGMEGYVAPKSRFDKDAQSRWPFHITLLAQNETGFRNLLKLSSAAHLEGFYYRPRVDRELLERHSDGLIVLSGCPSGELLKAFSDGRDDAAREAAGWYRDVFPGRYYIELMEHGITQFSELTPKLVDLGRELEIPLVLTNDSHYVNAGDHHAHEVLLCIGTNSTMHDEKRFKLDGNSFYLKSEQEMRALLPELPEAADNTALIAEQVDIKLEFGRTLLPDPGVPAGMTARQYLRELCEEGLARRYAGVLTEAQRERLYYELDVIEQTGFDEYMLIVRDIAHFARGRGIPMGVRGSAAASVVLYVLDVIDIEPMQYNLTFERFLNPERLAMPDVDFDFADDRREEVIHYVAERYGRDRVAQIITFGTLGAKAAIRDSGRALGIAFGEVDRVARLVPDVLHMTIDGALAESEELRRAYEDEAPVRELIDTAKSLEGVARHASTHAAGVVISRDPLSEVVPLQRATASSANEDSLPTTQWAMAEIEKIGLLKVDFLGLTNLTILGAAVELIEQQRGERIDLLEIPDGDEATARLLASGDTFGVFQMESSGMRRYVTELQPANIRELSAMVALFRPGPMEHIPRYIELKHGRSTPYYPHEDLAGVLDETYGVMVYQDQVLQIARTFAGYSLGQADVMRKAMGKKIADVMLAERDNFVKGCLENGYEQKLAEDLFDLIEPFAGYGFNKAHAFTYGTIAYQTAYLKAHYPVEYMAAVLMSASGSQDRITAAIAECRRMRIAVLPPDVSCSQANFSVETLEDGTSAIRYGLAQVKNVGEGGIAILIAEREAEGPFTSLENFARRINPREVNRRVIESLAQAGALDAFGERGTLIGGVDRVLSLAQQEQRLRETGQSSMFDLFGDQVDTPLPALELQAVDVPRQELLALEREVLGTYISEHPFQQAARDLERYVTHQSVEVTADLGGHDVVVAGMVASVRSLTTRQGKPFAALTIEDLSGQAELTIWPDSYEQHRELFTEGTVVLAKVQVRTRGDRLTLAVQSMCRYSFDARALIDFEEQKFAIGRGKRQVAEGGARYGAAQRPGDGSGRGPGPSGGGPEGGLRVIPPRPKEAEMATANPDETSGPRRLRVDLEETMDEPADLRRLRRVCAALDRHPANGNGTLPVELRVLLRDRTRTSLDRGAIDPAAPEALIPELNALLGVLGGAAEIGTAVAVESGGAAAAGGG